VGTDPSASVAPPQQGMIAHCGRPLSAFWAGCGGSNAINPRGSGGLVPQSFRPNILGAPTRNPEEPQKKGFRVIVRFRKSRNRRDEERQILQQLRGTFRLLNDLRGYCYEDADATDERRRIQRFIDDILVNPYRSN